MTYSRVMNRRTMFERAVSKPRMSRYLTAYEGDWKKAQRLYLANLRVSQKLYAIISVFEVALRNAIDEHYRNQFIVSTGTFEWLKTQSSTAGFLSDPTLAKGGFQSRENVKKVISNLRTYYTHDKVVSELSFGFWKYMFAAKEFAAAGSTLLRIFLSRPRGVNHTDVYKKLDAINRLRNRVAHHQPTCFDKSDNVSLTATLEAYNSMLDILTWLGYDTKILLKGVDGISLEVKRIYGI